MKYRLFESELNSEEKLNLCIIKHYKTNRSNNSSTISMATIKSFNKKYTLALDLDSTLIYSKINKDSNEIYDDIICFTSYGEPKNFYVKYRNNLEVFLKFVVENFNVVIYTASVSEYCNIIVNNLIRKFNLPNICILDRKYCTLNDGSDSYSKDLNWLGTNLSYTILIDDTKLVASNQPRNLLQIEPFVGTKKDNDLLDIMDILMVILNNSDQSVYEILDVCNSQILV